MLQYCDGIEVSHYIEYRIHKYDFLGFLPLIDVDGLEYYTVENKGRLSDIFARVSPVIGEESDMITELEYWFTQPIPQDAREERKLYHEYYRDEFIKRLQEWKYCVRFLGCDDADYFMRFKNKEHALEFLNTVSSFDEIYNHEHSMMW